MERPPRVSSFGLVDEHGTPLPAAVQEALSALVPRLARDVPQLRDDAVIAELLEKVGQTLVRRTAETPIKNLRGYAWVVLRRAAVLYVERFAGRVDRATLAGDEGAAVLATLETQIGTAEVIEREILYDQALGVLSDVERRICAYKRFGYTSEEIGEREGMSVDAVNSSYYRCKQRIGEVLGGAGHGRTEVPASSESRHSRPDSAQEAGHEHPDGKAGGRHWRARPAPRRG